MKHIGFLGLLTIVLVILKATGYIDWSWWLVFVPVMIPYIIYFAAMALLFVGSVLVAVFAAILAWFSDRR
jgi:hypothetical protein